MKVLHRTYYLINVIKIKNILVEPARHLFCTTIKRHLMLTGKVKMAQRFKMFLCLSMPHIAHTVLNL